MPDLPATISSVLGLQGCRHAVLDSVGTAPRAWYVLDKHFKRLSYLHSLAPQASPPTQMSNVYKLLYNA